MTNSICNYLFLLTCYSAFWGIWMFLHFPEGFAMCRTPPFSCLLVCVFADSVLHWFDRWSQRCGFFRSHLGPSTALTVFTVTTTYVANGKIQTFVLLLLSAAEDVCGILPDEISLKTFALQGLDRRADWRCRDYLRGNKRAGVISLFSAVLHGCETVPQTTWRLCLVTQAEASTDGRCLLASGASDSWTIIANQSTQLFFGLVWTALIHCKRHLKVFWHSSVELVFMLRC